MIAILLSLFLYSSIALSSAEYEGLINNVRKKATFVADVPVGNGFEVHYQIELGESLFENIHVNDFFLMPGSSFFYRSFTDKILLNDGSFIQIGDTNVPATCIFVHGQDNRMSGKDTPLIPDLILRFTIVANDFSCTGPINPNWPEFSAKKEAWDTFIYFEVRDPTIMLPTDIRLRYRSNEFSMIKKEI